MKRFWLVLLALGLIVATATVSFAQVTVRFSGEFYAGGLYLDRIGARDVTIYNDPTAADLNDQSTAFSR